MALFLLQLLEMIQIVLKADARTRSNLRQNPVVTRSDCHELVFAEYRRCRTPTVLSETAPTLAHFRSKRYLTRWRCSLTLLALCSKLWIRTVPLVSVGGRLERIPRDNRSRAAVTSSERTCISWGQQSGSSALVFMQPSNSQSCSDRRQDRFRVASGPRSIPPGALAGYLQAQQAWRKAQANARHTESSGTQQCQTSVLRGSASANSTNSCSTSDRRLEVYGTCNLPALGCKTVARLFERRHELMVRHRHQRQAAKRRKLSAAAPEAPSGLLGLPEDVLVRAAIKSFCTNCIVVLTVASCWLAVAHSVQTGA